MSSKKVLIVARDTMLTGDFADRLRLTGFSVECAENADSCVQVAGSFLPEVVVVGDDLPDVTPVELTWRIRSNVPSGSAPIFVMDFAARSMSSPTNGGLNNRTDKIGEMVERTIALFGRADAFEQPDDIRCHGIRLDRGRHRAWINNRPLQFTPTEFKLLWELARRPGYVLSRDDLTKFCKSADGTVQSRTIDAHIKTIRRKLDSHSKLIETVHGVGYRFRETEPATTSSV